MKKLLLCLLVFAASLPAQAQLVARMEVKEPIEGICDAEEVYALFPSFDGQVEAVCPVSDAELLNRLNTQVAFLKENPKYKDKGMIRLIVNCKGEIVQCEVDTKTSKPELDRQIEAVFNNLGAWKAGKLNGKAVDSVMLISFKIKNGKFELE